MSKIVTDKLVLPEAAYPGRSEEPANWASLRPLAILGINKV